MNSRIDTAGVLLKAGAKVDSVDQYEMTALHNAALNGHEGIVEVLLKKGAYVNEKGWLGRTFAFRC